MEVRVKVKRDITINVCNRCMQPFNGEVHTRVDGEYCTGCYNKMKEEEMRADEEPEGPAKFLKSLEWDKRKLMTFIGPCIFVLIAKEKEIVYRFAKITLDSLAHFGLATQGDFTGVRVEIIDTYSGCLDKHEFLFDDVLTGKDRVEPKNLNNCFDKGFKVTVREGKWDWYVATPKSTKAFTKVVEDYIEMFTEEYHRGNPRLL